MLNKVLPWLGCSLLLMAASPRFDYHPLEFNEGKAYQLPLNQAPILQLNTVEQNTFPLLRFLNEKRYPDDTTAPADRVSLYRVDLSGDKRPEYLVVPNQTLTEEQQYLPTLQTFPVKPTVPPEPAAVLPIAALSVDDAFASQDYYRVRDIRDFNGDGRLDVLLESGSGASSYQTMTHFLWFDGKAYRLQTLHQWATLYNFDHDSKIELALSSPADFDGATEVGHAWWTYWRDLYQWQGGAYKPASTVFKDYYIQVMLPEYERQITSLKAEAPNNERELAIKARQQAIQRCKSLAR